MVPPVPLSDSTASARLVDPFPAAGLARSAEEGRQRREQRGAAAAAGVLVLIGLAALIFG